MKTIIRVTQECIDQAVIGIDFGQLSARVCPIAQALNNCTNTKWSVGTRDAGCGIIVISLPKNVIQFINDFDSNKATNPFSFEIDLPDEVFL